MTNPFAAPPQAPAQTAPQPPVAATTTNPFNPAQTVAPVQQQPAAPAAAGEDPFDAPAPPRARAPRLRDLYGRLVILIPHKLEEGIRSQFKDNEGNAQLQDRLTMDIVVLDGGTIHYGGSPESVPPVPHDKTAEPPAKWEKVYDSHAAIISQCRQALAKIVTHGRPGMVLGRLTIGDKKGGNNAPFILQPATDADKQIALQYVNSRDPFA